MAEDLNELRLAVSRIIKTQLQRVYGFRMEVEDQPADLELLCKSVSYPMSEIDTDDFQIGPGVRVMPVKKAVGEVTVTLIEHEDGRVKKWLNDWYMKIFNEDGTSNMPSEYVRTVKIYPVRVSGGDTGGGTGSIDEPEYTGKVFYTKCGEITRSREEGGFLEIQATFIEFEA